MIDVSNFISLALTKDLAYQCHEISEELMLVGLNEKNNALDTDAAWEIFRIIKDSDGRMYLDKTIGHSYKWSDRLTLINDSTIFPNRFDASSLIIESANDRNVHIIRDASHYNMEGAFTLTGWWKGSDWNSNVNQQHLYTSLSTFLMYMQNNVLHVRAFSDVSNVTESHSLTLTNDTWYLIGLMYDGAGNWYTIVNDVITNLVNQTIVLNNEQFSTIRIGERQGFGVSIDAIADEHSLIKRMLTQDEVTSLYNNGKAIKLTDLLLSSDIANQWRQDKSTPTIYKDVYGTYDGVYINSPSISTDVPE